MTSVPRNKILTVEDKTDTFQEGKESLLLPTLDNELIIELYNPER
jgi:hypothetical protein